MMQSRTVLCAATMAVAFAVANVSALPIPHDISAMLRRSIDSVVKASNSVIIARDDMPATLKARSPQTAPYGYPTYYPYPYAYPYAYPNAVPTNTNTGTPLTPVKGANSAVTPDDKHYGFVRTFYFNTVKGAAPFANNVAYNTQHIAQYTGAGIRNMGQGIGNYAKGEARETAAGTVQMGKNFKNNAEGFWHDFW